MSDYYVYVYGRKVAGPFSTFQKAKQYAESHHWDVHYSISGEYQD